MRTVQNMLGGLLAAAVSLFLLAGGFLSSVDGAVAALFVGLGLPLLVVLVVAAALLLPQMGGALTYVTRFSALGAAAVAAIQGAWGTGVALAIVAVVMWGSYWAAGRRVGGRSVSGVFRDVRYAVGGLAKR